MSAAIVLVGEARGEHVFLEKVSAALRAQLGPDGAIHVELDPRDLTPDERRECLTPRTHADFAAALRIPESELPARIAEAESRFGIGNLRRLWRTDLDVYRDGAPDSRMAREALGYLAFFDRLARDRPDAVGGFAEESGRLIKRAFRAVFAHHGRRPVIAHPLPLPGRVLFVDQEDPGALLPRFDEFEPSPESAGEAQRLVDAVTASGMSFAEPRDLRLTTARIRNFVRLAGRQAAGSAPGAANIHLGTFTRDYVRQRRRVAAVRAVAQKPDQLRRPGVLFPLHVQADTQLTIRGEAYRDQIAVISHLAESLPLGYDLWVKPHPVAAGELPARRLVGLVRQHGNVRLIDPAVHVHSLLGDARAAVTVSSTTGFEALMFGVPLVVLGDKSLYGQRGLTHDVLDPNDLAAGLAAALRSDAPNRAAVERLLAYYLDLSHPAEPIYRDMSEVNAGRFAEALLATFRS